MVEIYYTVYNGLSYWGLDNSIRWIYTVQNENFMNKLNKYIVPVNLIVYGENEADALDYVQHALDISDLLDQDGIVGVNSDIELDDIEFYEE